MFENTNHSLSWIVKGTNGLLCLCCLLLCIGCSPKTVRLVSKPSGAKFTVYDKKGKEVRFDLQNQVTPAYISWKSNYDRVKFEMTGYPSQTSKKIGKKEYEWIKSEPYKIILFPVWIALLGPFHSPDEYRAVSGEISVDLTKVTVVDSQGIHYTNVQSNVPAIEQVISTAIQKAILRVQKNSVLAVVPITTDNKMISDYLTGEIEYLLVGHGLSVVDRSQLDRIRTEQRLQLSGEIDSNTISSIGRFSGADYIVTGSVDGSGSLQRLRLQVLDVQTADVIGTASEQYGESQPITNPIGIDDAIRLAIENATTKVTQNSRLAIVDITVENDIKPFITGEAENKLKNKGFRIVDRAQLDRVRAEQSIQQSNEFDDRTTANIGKLAGADYLITIRVDGRGELTRLRWRVLNTQTALVAGAASVHFERNNSSSTTPLTLDNARKSALEQATARMTKDTRLANGY